MTTEIEALEISEEIEVTAPPQKVVLPRMASAAPRPAAGVWTMLNRMAAKLNAITRKRPRPRAAETAPRVPDPTPVIYERPSRGFD